MNKTLIKSDTLHKAIGYFTLILLCIWYVYNYFYGERIPYNGGLGWDGATYAEWTQHSPWETIKYGISVYYIQRLLPSSIIYFVAKLLHYNLGSNIAIIHAFYLLNCCMLIWGAIMLWLIAKHLRWDRPVFYVAFALVFLIYPVIKYSTYGVTLTDISAFSLGIATFYYYLKNNLPGLIIVTLAASFTYPSMLYAALPLLIFKSTPNSTFHISEKITKSSHYIATGIGLIAVVAVLYKHIVKHMQALSSANQINEPLITISIVCLFLYIYFASRKLIDYDYAIYALKHQTCWKRIGLALILLILVKATIVIFSDSSAGPLTPGSYLSVILLSSIVNPATNLLSHIIFFGPGILLIVFLWKQICLLAKQHGPGLILFMLLYVLLAICPESRQFINAWPVFAILTCQVLSRYNISWYFTYSIIAISIVMTRFWLPLNIAPWHNDQLLSITPGLLLKFPEQMLFMSTGHWMSNLMYGVFLAVAIIMGIGVYALLRQVVGQQEDRLERV